MSIPYPRARMFSLALAFLILTVATSGFARNFEVWLVDQEGCVNRLCVTVTHPVAVLPGEVMP